MIMTTTTRALMRLVGVRLRDDRECNHANESGGHTFADFGSGHVKLFICEQCGRTETEDSTP